MTRWSIVCVLTTLMYLMGIRGSTETLDPVEYTDALASPERREQLLRTYPLPTGEQALLFTRQFTKRAEVAGRRLESPQQLLYLEIEDIKTHARRRIWQQSFRPFAEDRNNRITSLAFALGEKSGTVCFGVASEHFIYYYLIDINQTLVPEERKEMFVTDQHFKLFSSDWLPYYLHLLTVFSHNSIEGDELLTYGATLEGIAYSQQEGWRLDIRMHDASYTLIGTLPNDLPALWNEQLKWFSARYEEGNLQEHPVSWRVIRK